MESSTVALEHEHRIVQKVVAGLAMLADELEEGKPAKSQFGPDVHSRFERLALDLTHAVQPGPQRSSEPIDGPSLEFDLAAQVQSLRREDAWTRAERSVSSPHDRAAIKRVSKRAMPTSSGPGEGKR